jgi:hypothetical protein
MLKDPPHSPAAPSNAVWLLLAAAWLVTRVLLFAGVSADREVTALFDHVAGGAGGDVPAIGWRWLVALPAGVSASADGFARALAAQMLLFDGVLFLLIALGFRHAGPAAGGADGSRVPAGTPAVPAAYVVLTAIIGPTLLVRPDLPVALCLAAAVMLAARARSGRDAWAAAGFLALGATIHPIALALAPVVLIASFRTLRTGVRALVEAAAAIAAGCAAGVLGGTWPSPGGVLQITGSGSALLALWNQAVPLGITVVEVDGARVLSGPDLVSSVALVSGLLVVLGVAGLAVATLRIPRDGLRRALPGLAVAAGLLPLALGTEFRSHHLAWVLVLLAIAARDAGPGLRGFGAAAVLVLVSRVIGRFYTRDLAALDAWPTVLLALRNALALGLAVAVFLDARAGPDRPRPWRDALARLPVAPAVAALSTLAVFAWAALANLSPLMNNDVFLQLRVGADILRDFAVPTVDVYSATAAGRPFLAHEWLASVLFQAINGLLGIPGLCLLPAAVVPLVAWMLVASVPAPQRRRAWFWPIVLLAVGVLSYRAMTRPHLFSFVGLAAITFALESWRRTGRVRDLLWLIPMQAVWTNLHGESSFGPPFLAMCAVAVLAHRVLPGLPVPGQRPFARRDPLVLAGIAVAMGLASLANPYGIRLFAFSGQMFGGNDYIKQSVWEWSPTLSADKFGLYWTWAWAAFSALLLGGVLARIRQRPWLDLAIACVAVFASSWAIRLLPFAILLGFPVVIRSLESLAVRFPSGSWTARRPLFELVLSGLLIGGTFAHGFAYAPSEGRPFGWGLGANLPLQEIAFLRSSPFQGAIFNDYGDGALLIHALHPRIRPVVDSRIDIYGPELWGEYVAARRSPDAFRAYLDRHSVTLAMLSPAPEDQVMLDVLRQDPGWERVLQTPLRLIYARRPPGP